MIAKNNSNDVSLQAIKDALSLYKQQHASADITVYRQNSVCVRARIVDPDFCGIKKQIDITLFGNL